LRFFFLFIYDEKIESGVNKKIFSLVRELNTSGIVAKLILIGDQNEKTDSPYIIWKMVPVNNNATIFTRILHSWKIADHIRSCIKNFGSSDILYIRYPLLFLFCPVSFFKPFRKCKLIFEYNTNFRSEYILGRNNLYLFLEFFLGNIVLLQADGGIGVTDEITNSMKEKLVNKNKPFITISNGIELNLIPVREAPKIDSDQNISLLCVANFSPWHGIDRLILGLARYSGNYSFTLHLVGNGIEVLNLKKLCVQYNVSHRVIFHNFMSGRDLDKLFNESHIAVGTLGLHRNRLKESSTLKSREYCARGIPFILSSSDTDFPDTFPYIQRVPPDDSAIDMEQVSKFALRVCLDYEHPEKMRKYAAEHLDVSIKMKKLKTFLEEKIIKSDDEKM